MTPLSLTIDRSVGDPTRLREGPFLHALFEAAQRAPDWPPAIRSIVVVSAHRRHLNWPALEAAEGPVLCVALGDEDGRIRPAILDRCAVLLQQYVTGGMFSGTPVLHLPLGPGPSARPPLPRPWDGRDLDVVFVGHLHRHRWQMVRRLDALRPGLGWLPDAILPTIRRLALRPADLGPLRSHVQWTARFGEGVDHEDYLDLFCRAKVALVPPGFKQVETFRHHEAARAGCVLIGAPLAPYPVLTVPPDRPLRLVLQDLFSDPGALEQRHRAVQSAWHHQGAPTARGPRLARDLSRVLAFKTP